MSQHKIVGGFNKAQWKCARVLAIKLSTKAFPCEILLKPRERATSSIPYTIKLPEIMEPNKIKKRAGHDNLLVGSSSYVNIKNFYVFVKYHEKYYLVEGTTTKQQALIDKLSAFEEDDEEKIANIDAVVVRKETTEDLLEFTKTPSGNLILTDSPHNTPILETPSKFSDNSDTRIGLIVEAAETLDSDTGISTKQKMKKAFKLFGLPLKDKLSDDEMTFITKLYRKVLLKVHPDRGGKVVQFRNVNNAYIKLKELYESKSPKSASPSSASPRSSSSLAVVQVSKGGTRRKHRKSKKIYTLYKR
jgi:hypothetical protein